MSGCRPDAAGSNVSRVQSLLAAARVGCVNGDTQEESLGSAKELPVASASFQDCQPFTELEIGVQLGSFSGAQGFLTILSRRFRLRRRRYLERR